VTQNLLQAQGSHDDKNSGWAPIYTNRFMLGLATNRNPMRSPAGIISEIYYHLGTDAMWDGSNTEVSIRLTGIRRAGNPVYSPYSFASAPDTFYSFHQLNGNIEVYVDLATQIYQMLTPATITATVLITNVATFTAANNFVAGNSVTVTGTTNGGGIFNVTNAVITAAGPTAFSVALVNANVVSAADTGQAGAVSLFFTKAATAGQTYFAGVDNTLYFTDGVDEQKFTPGNTNSTTGIYNWGGLAPTMAPTSIITQSGSASAIWVANTVFSTMGLLLDSTGNVEFLTSVNLLGGNTTQLGSTGSGAPNFNTTTGATTTDGTCTWTSWGPIGLWTANTAYTNQQPIFDPVTGWIFQASAGTTGSARPSFNPTINTHTNDAHGMLWQAIGPAVLWQPNFTYHAWWEHTPCLVCWPTLPTQALITAGTQTVYLFTNNDQTTGSRDQIGISSSGYTPPWNKTLGNTGSLTGDNMLQWISLGSATWAALTEYATWYPGANQFSVVEDPYGDFQVCIATGQSGATTPGTQWQASHVYTGAQTIYVKNNAASYTKFTTSAGGTSAATQPTWNFTPASTTTDNTVTWTATAVTTTSVWGQVYGAQTKDGTVTWVNVGPILTWATGTQWYLPVNGFAPPTSSQPYGGASIDGGGFEETVISSGKTGSVQPNWPGNLAAGSPFTLTGVTYTSGQTASYAGTITGGGSNAFAGYLFTIAGFVTNPSNNGTNFLCTASSAAALTLVNPQAITETHAATATCVPTGSNVNDGTAIWFTESAFTQNSLAWKSGFSYAYSFYARTLLDGYGYAVGQGPSNVGLGPPPGWPTVLGPPTGSETGLVTNASPILTISGSNNGAVITLTGQGTTDPQFDTIIIWRSADGGGPGNMFQLTEIPNPAVVGGSAGTWTFADFLPSTATTINGVVYPGLDTLVFAPVALENSPPPAGLVNIVYFGNRIWGSVGATVYASAGPDAGNPDQVPGNGNEQFPNANQWNLPANVTRLVPTSIGLLVFTTSEIHIIEGGPAISQYVERLFMPNYGLLSWNALAQNGSNIYFLAADNRLMSLDVTSIKEIGFNIGDKLKANFNPATAYLTWHVSGSADQALYVGDGATGWYRGNPNQSPDASLTGPVWSPFATIVGGLKALASVEVTTGVRQLLLGATGAGTVANRDSSYTIFADRGVAYESYLSIGALVLAQPGQLAELAFITGEFVKIGTSPVVSVLLDEIDTGAVPYESLATWTLPNNGSGPNLPPQDSPLNYGATSSPVTEFANRYYFAQTIGADTLPVATSCRFMFLKIDFGNIDTVMNECLSITVFGKHWSEI
jgi:hypothetical protein